MGQLSITEYATLGRSDRGSLPAGEEPAIARQNVTFTAAPGTSVALNPKTRFVRLSCDIACAVQFSGVAATINDSRLAAGPSETFPIQEQAVRAGTLTLSAIQV